MTTSRIARKPVNIPSGVEVKITDHVMAVKGPKGKLSLALHPYINVDVDKQVIHVNRSERKAANVTASDMKLYRSIAGTTRANIFNVIHGVTQGFEIKLLLVGVGYRAQAKGKVLALSLGFSHPTEYKLPEGITIETPTQTEILVKGVDKELVGQVAAEIRSIRQPEPYKGKGVRYADETIELKETKKK